LRNGAALLPRYFFEVQNLGLIPDLLGDVLENDDEAWNEATKTAAQIFKDLDGRFRPGQEWGLIVYDEDRNPLYQIGVNSKQMK
jgi:hypothetical protein